jgi:inorganic pyrophosphatase
LVDKETGCFGDNDPIDIVDLTDRNMNIFDLPKLKIIGSLCLID